MAIRSLSLTGAGSATPPQGLPAADAAASTGAVQAAPSSPQPAPLPPDLPPDIAEDLDFARLLMDDMPEAQLRALFRKLAKEYDLLRAPDEAMLRRAMLAAQPYLQALGDDATESGVNDALETGVRIALLEEWLVRKQGMRPFPAALKAAALKGALPGQPGAGETFVIRG